MLEEQTMRVIDVRDLLVEVKACHDKGYRLVQICCTRTDVYEIDYSFDRNFEFVNLRVILPTADVSVPSISSFYWPALLYENEMHDLFGVKVEGMAIDFGGNFYKTAVKWPFGAARPSAAKPEGQAQP